MNMHPNYGESEGDNGFDARKKAICGEMLKRCAIQSGSKSATPTARDKLCRMKLELLQWQKITILAQLHVVL
jgi:hypothetical protein